MKKSLKWFILGFVAACMMITPMAAFADGIQVTLNSVNINLNGTQIAAKGQSYTLENGVATPYSLNYNGTLYLPIRKISELVGKDISYDGKSSLVSISDKTTDTKTPVTDVKPEDPTNSNTNVKQDPVNDTTDKESATITTAEAKNGFAVINSFMKELNASGIQVNRLEGLLDGTACSLLTSKKDMITFSSTVPSLYSIKYSNNIITEMNLVSADVTDTVKVNMATNSLEGTKGTYTINPNAAYYKVVRDDDNTIEEYKVASSINVGYKVYLYETIDAKGYDIILMEK